VSCERIGQVPVRNVGSCAYGDYGTPWTRPRLGAWDSWESRVLLRFVLLLFFSLFFLFPFFFPFFLFFFFFFFYLRKSVSSKVERMCVVGCVRSRFV